MKDDWPTDVLVQAYADDFIIIGSHNQRNSQTRQESSSQAEYLATETSANTTASENKVFIDLLEETTKHQNGRVPIK